MALDRITHDPLMMGGKPCIRGMRGTADTFLGQFGAEVSMEDLLDDFPYLEREDILQAMEYGAWLAQERVVDLVDP